MKQIKSRQRVSKYGEVYTNKSEVHAMLDLIPEMTKSIKATFLEPACGNGNFLIEIFARKMKTVSKLYSYSENNFVVYSILALSSIYGIDIQNDNVKESRVRLANYFIDEHYKRFKSKPSQRIIESMNIILKRNIVWGDSLSYRFNNGQPITFTEWILREDNCFIRKDFLLEASANPNIEDIDRPLIVYKWFEEGEEADERKETAS